MDLSETILAAIIGALATMLTAIIQLMRNRAPVETRPKKNRELIAREDPKPIATGATFLTPSVDGANSIASLEALPTSTHSDTACLGYSGRKSTHAGMASAAVRTV